MTIDHIENDPAMPQFSGSPSMPPQRTIEAVYRDGHLLLSESIDLPEGMPISMRLAVRVTSIPAQNGDQNWELVPHLEVETVEAIYENGTIRFLSPANLPEDTPLQVSMIWRQAMLATLRMTNPPSGTQTLSTPGLATSASPTPGASANGTTAQLTQTYPDATHAANLPPAEQTQRWRGTLDRISAALVGMPGSVGKTLPSRFAQPLRRKNEAVISGRAVFGRRAKMGDAAADVTAQSGVAQPRVTALRRMASVLASLSATQLRWLTIIGIALALLLVYSGQALLSRTVHDDPRLGLIQAQAGAMFIAGALLFGVLAGRTASLMPRLEFPQSQASLPALVWHDRWSRRWLSAAIVLAIGALGLFITLGETPAVVLSWLMSIVALLVAQLWGVRVARPRIAQEEWPYLAALAIVLVVTFFTRTYKLTTLPYNVNGDFVEFGLKARELATGQQHQIFAYDGWGGMPILGYLPSWLTMSLFGTGLVGLYASGVLDGLLVIVGVYLLGRDLFHARVGLIAAALLMISYTHLAASRQSNYIDSAVFLVYAIYFLLLGLREDRSWAIVVSGVLTALCLQSYFSGRIIIFIAGFILFYLLLFRRPWLWARRRVVLLWVLAVFVTLGPMLVVFARDSNMLMARTRGVFLLSPEVIAHEQGVYHVDTLLGMLLEQARRTVLMFNYYGDTGDQFAFRRPYLDPFSAPLFILGIGYALLHWRRFGNALLLGWTALGALIGCFLTLDPPFWPRLMILLPPTALLAAQALDLLYEPVKRGLVGLRRSAGLVAPAALVMIIIAVGALNWNTYVAMKGTYATEVTRIARYLADQPPSVRGYLVSDKFTYRVRELQFLVPGRLVANLAPHDLEGNIAKVGAPTVLIMTSEQKELVEQLLQRFPSGSSEAHAGNAPNEVAFYVFRLP